MAYRQRFQLHERGLAYFDGRQHHAIPWDRVVEIREAVTTVRMYGVTASGPKPELELVTADGLCCALGNDVLELESLSPVVAAAVNASLRRQAQQALDRRNPVQFGGLSVSKRGIVIEAPASQPWLCVQRDRFARAVDPPVVQSCELNWDEVGSIQLTQTTRGDALADQTTYHRVEIRQKESGRPVNV